jgi:tripartite-type tricarboxylate transporter receptor subunit TctC
MKAGYLLTLTAAIAALAGSGFTWAQNYPTRPITMIVGYAVGGPSDTIARIMAERMSTSLGQHVVVENVTGASGSIGAGRVARAAPDGYTLAFGDWSTHVANGAAYALSYDVIADFRPVARLPSNPMLVLGRNGIPAETLGELIAWVRTSASSMTLASSGVGSPPHVAGAYFQNLIATQIPMVPYRGAAPALLDLVAGRTDLSMTQASFALPHVREGKVKAFAVTAPARWASAPDIPTVDEAGLPGFHMSVWRGLWAPRDTADGVIGKISSAVADALADPAVRRRLAEIGEEIPPREQQTPEALAALQRGEIEKWWPVIKAMGIKAE